MASLVLGAAGAYVGSFFGMPALGWAIGSAIGGAMTPGPHSESARLSDLKVQTSTYGMMIPILFGTNRVAGNVIWSTDLIETSHDVEQGKGGGGATVTNFTYSASFVVALCDGEIAGIRRIWANNKLILDASESNTGVTGQSGNIRVITGSMTQEPSALMESYLGAGNVSAYRGTAMCEFEDMQLEDYGNRLPNLSFEVVKAGSESVPEVTSYETDYPDAKFGVAGIGNMIWGYQTGAYLTDPNVLLCFDTINNEIILINEVMPSDVYDTYHGLAFVPTLNEVWITTDAYSQEVHIHDALTGFRKETITLSGGGTPEYWTEILYIPANDSVAIFSNYSAYNYILKAIDRTTIAGSTGPYWGSPRIYAASEKYIWIATGLASSTHEGISIHDLNTGEFIQGLGIVDTTYTAICFDTKRTQTVLWNSDLSQLVIVDEETFNITYNDLGGTFSAGSIIYLNEYDRYFAINNERYFIINPDTLELELNIVYSGTFITVSDIPSIGAAISGNNGIIYKFPYTPRIAPDQIFVADIITEICGMVGLTEGDIDVSDIDDVADGYVIAQQMPARSAIETLQPVYFFDAVESD